MLYYVYLRQCRMTNGTQQQRYVILRRVQVRVNRSSLLPLVLFLPVHHNFCLNNGVSLKRFRSFLHTRRPILITLNRVKNSMTWYNFGQKWKFRRKFEIFVWIFVKIDILIRLILASSGKLFYTLTLTFAITIMQPGTTKEINEDVNVFVGGNEARHAYSL